MSLPSSEGPANRALLSNPAAGLSLPRGTDMPPSRPLALRLWFRIPHPHPHGSVLMGSKTEDRGRKETGEAVTEVPRGRERSKTEEEAEDRQEAPMGRVENGGGTAARTALRVRIRGRWRERPGNQRCPNNTNYMGKEESA